MELGIPSSSCSHSSCSSPLTRAAAAALFAAQGAAGLCCQAGSEPQGLVSASEVLQFCGKGPSCAAGATVLPRAGGVCSGHCWTAEKPQDKH